MMQQADTNAMVLRKVGRYIEESVFEQLMWAIESLGVSHLWQPKYSPIGLTYTPTGQRIIFRGADDPKKIKSSKLKHGYFAYIWFEEYDEFDGDEEIRTINQSLMRGGDKFTVFYSYNPPKSINSWVNQDVIIPRKDTIVHHSDYRTVPIDWLGPVFLSEAEQLAKTKPIAYRHEYLGEVTGTGGQVFDNVILRKITDEEIKSFDHIKRGLDWGYAADPLAYGVHHFDKMRKKLYIFKEIYQVSLSNRKAAEYILAENTSNQQIICDSAEPKSIAEMKTYGINIKGAYKGPDSIDYGIKFLQDLEEIIIDPQRCPNAAREFSTYELERDKNGNFKGSYPDKNNHMIDQCRYSLGDEMNYGALRVLKPRAKERT
jgi:PBSX family phage terminase large subunit